MQLGQANLHKQLAENRGILQLGKNRKPQQYYVIKYNYTFGQKRMSYANTIETLHAKYRLTNSMLGSGSFGQVYIGVNLETEQKVAVKIIPIQHIQIAIQEASILQKLSYQSQHQEQNRNCTQWNFSVESFMKYRGKGVLKFLGTFRNYNQYYLVTQLYGKPLSQIIQHVQGSDYERIFRIFYAILKALKPLRQKQILHRDLKPDNILVETKQSKHQDMLEYEAKLCDFGFAIQEKPGQTSYLEVDRVGTIIYESPQVIKFKQYSQKSQIWSLGIILHLLLYKKLPFNRITYKDPQKIYQTMLSNTIRFSNVPYLIAKLGEKCLAINQNKRMSFSQLQKQVQEIISKMPIIAQQYTKKDIQKNKFRKPGNQQDDLSISTGHLSSTQQNISIVSMKTDRKQSQQLQDKEITEKNDIFIRLLLETYQQLSSRIHNQIRPKKPTTLTALCQKFLHKGTKKEEQYLNYFSPQVLDSLLKNINKMKIICQYAQDEKQISFNLQQFMLLDTIAILYQITKIKFQDSLNHSSNNCLTKCLKILSDNLQFKSQAKSMQYYKQLRNKVLLF